MFRILVCFVIILVLVNITVGLLISSAATSQSQINSNSIEEIRDNLVEVRLALQKGDLTEALQHLNNAEEQLLLIEENATSNSTIS